METVHRGPARDGGYGDGMSPSWGRLQEAISHCRFSKAADLQRAWVVSADYRVLIEALVKHRQNAGISQRELARRLAKPPSFVNKIELLERRLDVLEFIAMAEAMGGSARDLLAMIRCDLPEAIRL